MNLIMLNYNNNNENIIAKYLKNKIKNSIILSLYKPVKYKLLKDCGYNINKQLNENILDLYIKTKIKSKSCYWINLLEYEINYFKNQGFKTIIIPDIKSDIELNYFSKYNSISIFINNDIAIGENTNNILTNNILTNNILTKNKFYINIEKNSFDEIINYLNIIFKLDK